MSNHLRYCGNCRFWLSGYTEGGMGWCQNEAVKAKPCEFVNGNSYEGGGGVETQSIAVCELHEPIPVRYRTK